MFGLRKRYLLRIIDRALLQNKYQQRYGDARVHERDGVLCTCAIGALANEIKPHHQKIDDVWDPYRIVRRAFRDYEKNVPKRDDNSSWIGIDRFIWGLNDTKELPFYEIGRILKEVVNAR